MSLHALPSPTSYTEGLRSLVASRVSPGSAEDRGTHPGPAWPPNHVHRCRGVDVENRDRSTRLAFTGAQDK